MLAAVNIVVRTAAKWGPPIYQPTIRHQVTGPNTPALLAADASDYAAMRAATPVQHGQLAGAGTPPRPVPYCRLHTGRATATSSPKVLQQWHSTVVAIPASRSSGGAGTGAWWPRPAVTGPTPPPGLLPAGYTAFANQG